MAKFRCLVVLGTHVLALFLSAAAQQGFLNINCGATQNVTDSNITWIEDSNYVTNVNNALDFEQYNNLDTEPETLAEDVSPLLNFKSAFGINDSEWTSDPCFAIPWDGVRCDMGNPVRVLDINLSGKGLTGQMPQKCNLTRLESLRLQNNKLSGEIPSFLTTFPNLKELNLENNNFSGIIPPGLLNNSRLSLRIKGNPSLCQRYPSQCDPKGMNVGALVGFSLGVILFVLIVLMSIIIYRRRFSNKRSNENRSTEGSTSLSSVTIPNLVRCRQFGFVEMQTATQNFAQKIGKGGFGSVYLGCLQDGKEVAVKVLSASSKQGVPEFLNEIDLLSRVNHKHLVSLLGYCNDSNRLMLVYEYMAEGSLKDHLYGSRAEASPLDWKSRLQIALDAAEGLEYLHVKSTQGIIHRDVKSDNILLDRSMRAKVADFGLSKILGDEAVTRVITKIKGTFGYLDPEYASTGMLTERSDVYSFGVVLLEIICGRKPVMEELSEEEINIVKWVKLHVETTEDPSCQLMKIIDRNLSMSEDEMKSLCILLNLSIACTDNEGSKRPTMSKIVAGIRKAMSVIDPNKEPLCSTESSKKKKKANTSTEGSNRFLSVTIRSIITYPWKYLKKRKKAKRRSTEGSTSLLWVRFRQFDLKEMQTATAYFCKQIGQGGFGSVYLGCLPDGKQVAVKVLSASSKQGVAEFLNEINLLSRVNHKNLVTLLGFCNDSKGLMLVYEYMCRGLLTNYLYGSRAEASPLNWKYRLQIALDAAEGLEYLHVKCTPKITHRDVKSSNILLDGSTRAKVADFGLSKIVGDEVTHVTTTIKGTVGYLDPEYVRTGKLTERSDVYSFGVVLLEIICGRKPVMEELSEEEINIVKWARLHAERTEGSSRQLTDIVDRNLSMSEDEMKSLYILLNLSIACTHTEGSKRPTMSQIVAGIREAMSVTGPIRGELKNRWGSSLRHVGR